MSKREIRLRLDTVLHRKLIEFLVGLGTRRVHRWALGAVEHAKLDGGFVDNFAHLAAQRVDLADDLPLGDAADRRVAAHLGHGVGVHGEESGAHPQPRRGQSRFDAGMAGADNEDVEVVGKLSHDRPIKQRSAVPT